MLPVIDITVTARGTFAGSLVTTTAVIPQIRIEVVKLCTSRPITLTVKPQPLCVPEYSMQS